MHLIKYKARLENDKFIVEQLTTYIPRNLQVGIQLEFEGSNVIKIRQGYEEDYYMYKKNGHYESKLYEDMIGRPFTFVIEVPSNDGPFRRELTSSEFTLELNTNNTINSSYEAYTEMLNYINQLTIKGVNYGN